MRHCDARALTVDFCVWVREIQFEPLHQTARIWYGDPFAAFGKLFQNTGFNLQIPGKVCIACLQHGAGRRRCISSTLQFDSAEKRFVCFPEIRICCVDDNVTRFEFSDLKRPGAYRQQIGRRFLGLCARVLLENMLGDDQPVGAHERQRPGRIRLLEGYLYGRWVDDLNVVDGCVRVAGDRRRLGIGHILIGKLDILRREEGAVRPGYSLFQTPCDRRAICCKSAIFDCWNLCRQDWRQDTLAVDRRQRFIDYTAGVSIFAA